MTDTLDNYYTRTEKGHNAYPAQQGRQQTDVCIIGGGLAGMALALGLAERGKNVVLLEGQRIGWGASGRNGGFAMSGWAASGHDLVKRVGARNARMLFGLTKTAQKLIRQRIEKHGIACDPQNGQLVCNWFDNADTMRAEADFLGNTLGETVEYTPRDKVQDICKTERYHDGIFFPQSFHMHPLNYLNGIAAAFTKLGGRIFENTLATAIEGQCVRTAQSMIEAKDIVLCGSAYFNNIDRKIAGACLPISTYVMVTEPIDPALLASAISEPYAVHDTRWAYDYYRVLPDHRLLWGGRIGLGKSVPADLPQIMLADLIKVYPQLAGTKVDCAWPGIMGYTTHKMPNIGQARAGLWYCTHFGGSGVVSTTAGAEVLAGAIAEKDDTYKLFAPFAPTWAGGILGPLTASAVYFGWQARDFIAETKMQMTRQKA